MSFLCMLGLLGATSFPVAAQTQQKLMVAAIPYAPHQNLDFFFVHSVHPLAYIEQEAPGETPVFVTIITPDQKKAYEKAGYSPMIADENAGDINQYYIVSTKRSKIINVAARFQNPVYTQRGLELAYQLTQYTMLLKVVKGKEVRELRLGIHHTRQLHSDLVPPTGRVSADFGKATPAGLQSSNYAVPFVVLIFILLGGFLVYKRRKK